MAAQLAASQEGLSSISKYVIKDDIGCAYIGFTELIRFYLKLGSFKRNILFERERLYTGSHSFIAVYN
jgi:hypothetical protein